jgi:large subunit ribosomal protein L3
VVSKLIGTKLGMTQVFNARGEVVPVTIVKMDDSIVIDKKTAERDGYVALKLGTIDTKKPKNMSKAVKGNFKNEKKKLDLPLKSVLSEVRLLQEEADKFNVGDVITVDSVFKEGDFIDVAGVSKGKGFQGVMKRHNFKGGPGSHGSMMHRAPGSIGSSTFPARVFKNMKMAGRLGFDRVTVLNLQVEKIDSENKYMLIKGAVPGANNGRVLVKHAAKKQHLKVKK